MAVPAKRSNVATSMKTLPPQLDRSSRSTDAADGSAA